MAKKGAAQDGRQKSEEQKGTFLGMALLKSPMHLLVAHQHHAAVPLAEAQAQDEILLWVIPARLCPVSVGLRALRARGHHGQSFTSPGAS